MATWAIGDIQGCADEFDDLLRAIRLRPGHDRVVLVGDVVNRGPDSLRALRVAKNLDAAMVLGNHDLHLLAVAGGVRKMRGGDTIGPILEAEDRDELLRWLRGQPFVRYEKGWRVVHAGLLPTWERDDIDRWARKASDRLAGDDWREAVAELFDRGKTKRKSVRAVNVMTRVRMVDADGRPDFSYKGPPERRRGRLPWFEARAHDVPTVFGHWAALGHRSGDGWLAIDSGCVWGNALTAVNLTSGVTVSVPARR